MTGLYETLRHQDNLATRYGLPEGVSFYARAIRDRSGDRDLVFVSIGTPEDHVNRSIAVPPLLAGGPRAYQDWLDEELGDVADEYRSPLRRLYAHAGAELAAAAVLSDVWPPLADSGAQND